MVFGVFDGLHEGHRYFLTEAGKLCDALFVVVASDRMVEKLKGRAPKHLYKERVTMLRAFNPTLAIAAGDEEIGEWQVVKRHAPDVVIVGHDQGSLLAEIRFLAIPFTQLEKLDLL